MALGDVPCISVTIHGGRILLWGSGGVFYMVSFIDDFRH